MLRLDTDIQFVKGVGEKRAQLYHKLNITTVRDLLWHFPRDYIDLSHPLDIASAPVGEPAAIRAVLTKKGREQRVRGGLSIFKLLAEDSSGEVELTLFNSKYTVDSLQLDREYLFYGKLSGGSLLRREMSAPAIYPVPDKHAILPVYPQTAGLSSKLIRAHIANAMGLLEPLRESLPAELLERYGLLPLPQAMEAVHFPKALTQVQPARSRFIFEELLALSLALASLHGERQEIRVPPMSPVDMAPFYRSLPFSPTEAQIRCIREAVADMEAGVPMNRLVQGDVGSGKTLVVAACCYFARENGRQSAVMVPTEILAEQHHATLTGMLEPFGVRTALLTGSTPAAARREILARLEAGETDLCIGTHALLSDGVAFPSLSLVVTDEQHRFGVGQRAKLTRKSENCHVLVLSATPIPRTLSLIIYGDLKLSTIDQLPPGRQPVETLVIGSSKRARALGFIRSALDQGRQAYIVCPIIAQGEVDTGLKPATEYAEQLSRGDFKGYRVGLLHGRMKAREKDEIMRRFKSGELQVLVSTTVVEVGVDVPNATIILIENAERFGLSQLHQLRGRVGRGREKSYCILLSDARGHTTRQRLKVMKSTSDGFKVAEEDLRLRGPGDFFGYRQHGLPELRIASLAEDMALLRDAQDCAQSLLEQDPALALPAHAGLRQAVDGMLRAVGERPN